MTDTRECIATNLKALFDASGLSQRKFATELGITQPTLMDYMRGERDPSLAFLQRMSELTGQTIDNIIGGPVKPPRGGIKPDPAKEELKKTLAEIKSQLTNLSNTL